ncbi:autophagy-related protein 17 [Amylocarpus encephaloides]|uniref:Autophagy-related protein 17 n=1 Tax=Amylocarpus encephaloides TaxID=45428 RepID=A0A9P7YMT6_9HELO|nr:autophagy-related protein 17 [Amylocarpus encephaloides]
MASPTNDATSDSQSSLSPSHSHTTSHRDTPLQTLVSHLLTSKRSLSSIHTVWRANEIVTTARTALEESVVLNARNGFLRSGILEQVKVLKKARSGIEHVYDDGQRDFGNVIHTLDAANARLESTMDILRSTMVEAVFRPAGEEPRSLLYFVEEESVENMRNALKESIRETKEAQTDFHSSIVSFDDDLRALTNSISASQSTASKSCNNPQSPIPEYLHTLETHARAMAALLEDLVRHFDLCKNAIRHTEGGYAAVRKAASSQPPDSDPVSVSGFMTTENESAHEGTISEEGRREMLDVLEKDAPQVEDVVMELREYLAEMEVRHEGILEYVSSLNATYKETTEIYQVLKAVGTRLPGYIIASQDFRMHWEDTKIQIQEQLTELESMRLFYENYYSSYDSMILEVHRRKQCEEKVKGIMKKAMEQINKVYEVDMKEREGFRIDAGDFLPVDLFPGINTPAATWEFVLTEDQDPVLASLPCIENIVVEAASRREKEKHRTDR